LGVNKAACSLVYRGWRLLCPFAHIIIRAVKEAAAEVREAKQADSDGGKKITPEEALEIVEVVFAAVMPDLVEEISRH
jgi:hypothetical protein